MSNPNADSLLGPYHFSSKRFKDVEKIMDNFDSNEFKKLLERQKFYNINQKLLELIQDTPQKSFLLPAILDFISYVNQRHLLKEFYHLTLFEFWMNQFSKLTPEEMWNIRGKIAGKLIPREDYQAFFPIGMNKVFEGTHFVAAHLSPDVDTTIASFWGWIDAFAAQVCSGLHLWSLPEGPPSSPVMQIMREVFGESVFQGIARTTKTLTLTAMDLVTQEKVFHHLPEASINSIDHGFGNKAIIFVDQSGNYQGDWRSSDVEMVRQVIILIKTIFHWFENNVHTHLISLFTQTHLSASDVPAFLKKIFNQNLKNCAPVREFSISQKQALEAFLQHIFLLPQGIQTSFAEIAQSLIHFGENDFSLFIERIMKLGESDLFERDGNLKENRPLIFAKLQTLIDELDHVIHRIRAYVERLDVAMQIKQHVLGYHPEFVTIYSDLDDIRLKMKNYSYLTVVIQEKEHCFFPIGVVFANALRKPVLGTVTFRDFCNLDEVKMSPSLSVISVVDHHKTSLSTTSTPLAIIGDAQSCNVLIAEQALLLNQRYSLSGISSEKLEEATKTMSKKTPLTATENRLFQRILKRKMASQSDQKYFIHPDREYAEYLCFLHAILDDTDLLTKVTNRDVDCVASLVNQLTTLTEKEEVEIVNFDNISKDEHYAKKAARLLLKNPQVYALYHVVYNFKEKETEQLLQQCLDDDFSLFFSDTKEQNGCCRVGQTKLFSPNFSSFHNVRKAIQKEWVMRSQDVSKHQEELDLHLHMISTIPTAEEVYKDQPVQYSHQDEFWFWLPPTQQALSHLAAFLNAFQTSHIQTNKMKLELLGANHQELKQVFTQNFLPISITENSSLDIPIAVLSFQAGILNSRKSMVSPYLPKLVS